MLENIMYFDREISISSHLVQVDYRSVINVINMIKDERVMTQFYALPHIYSIHQVHKFVHGFVSLQ